MRALLAKDLRILRRSPVLVGLLVVYPLLIALLLGLALSKGPGKPRVAVLNELPSTDRKVTVAGTEVDPRGYAKRLFASIEPVAVHSRAEAARKVRDGDVLAAIIVPSDLVTRLQSTLGLSVSTRKPTVEILVSGKDPVRRQFVESAITARVAELNRAVSTRVIRITGDYLTTLQRGGKLTILGREIQILGLTGSKALIDSVLTRAPRGSPDRAALEPVANFAQLAIANLDFAKPVLSSIGTPVQVRTQVIAGHRTALDAFAVSVAVTISLFLVTVLLASGMLALEHEDHVFARLLRGLVSRTGLVVEKLLLGALCGTVAAALLTAAISIFVSLDWSRAALWVVALAVSGLAFGAFGVAIGALARDVRAASLLAILLALPIAFVALVPSGSVAPGLADALQAISSVFPFDPALDSIDGALNGSRGVGGPLAHLGVLLVGWAAVARFAITRGEV
jgi:ABC-type multidrug transport system permease subunit